jgi:large subunit ribosomal protein L15
MTNIELTSIMSKSKKRVGRGSSSGRGKTSGRGAKGQKARNSVPWFMTGGSRRNRFSKTIPTKRGLRNSNIRPKNMTISTDVLCRYFKDGDVVSYESLVERGVIESSDVGRGVKIVMGKGEWSGKISLEVPSSKTLGVKQ